MIDDSQGLGQGAGTMRFALWPAQIGVFYTLMTEKLVVVLKARQLGISWCVCMYVLWCCLFKPGQHWLLYSKGQQEANELIRRIKDLYDRLPAWMRESLPKMVLPPSIKQVAWTNGSKVRSMPATPSSGVSYTASGIVLDEAAKMTWARKLYASAKPTVDAGGQLFMVSTADGIGNLFAIIWELAVKGVNGFKAVFLPWWSRPGRDRAWYDGVVRASADPKLVKQEYPATAQEAFLVSGRTRFEPEWFDNQKSQPPIPRTAWPDRFRERPDWPLCPDGKIPALLEIPALYVFAFPEPGRRYVVAADVAEGKDETEGDDPDYDAAVVIDEQTCEEVACLHGQWEPDEYAKFLGALGWAYNMAPVVVERNNHGHAVMTALKLWHYPDIARGHDGDPGWHTNNLTKPQGIDLLAEFLRDGLLTVRYDPTLYEMRYYSVQRNGQTSAPSGRHDDLVMAWYLALSYLRHRRHKPRQGPPRAAGRKFKVTNFLGHPGR